MDSPFQVSECRTTSPQHNDASSLLTGRSLSPLMYPDTPSVNSMYTAHPNADRQLFASPSPILYRCSASFTPVSSLPPWSPFRTPFELSLSFHSPPDLVQSVSPIVRSDSQHRPCSSTAASTPFVQRLLSVRPPTSPPQSIVSLSSDPIGLSNQFDSPLSSPPSSQDGNELAYESSFVESIADKVKRSRRATSSSLSTQTIPEHMSAAAAQTKRKADFTDEIAYHPSKIRRREQVDNTAKTCYDLHESRLGGVTTYSLSDYPVQKYPCRTFLPDTPLHSVFPLFYRRFPLSSHQAANSPKISGATFNAPRSGIDLYTPRFVKGTGREKLGLCPICVEPLDRGGQGKKVWLSTKFSAFKYYHMQYNHGISVISAAPFSPPVAFRVKVRPHVAKHERDHITEGRCHKCNKWIALETVKDTEVKVKEIFWWKHAASCHQGSTIAGECDIFLEDSVFINLRK